MNTCLVRRTSDLTFNDNSFHCNTVMLNLMEKSECEMGSVQFGRIGHFSGHCTMTKEISLLQVSKHSDEETEELLDHYYVMLW